MWRPVLQANRTLPMSEFVHTGRFIFAAWGAMLLVIVLAVTAPQRPEHFPKPGCAEFDPYLHDADLLTHIHEAVYGFAFFASLVWAVCSLVVLPRVFRLHGKRRIVLLALTLGYWVVLLLSRVIW